MSTVIARRVASTPARSAAETWKRIVSLLAPEPRSDARAELNKATGVACASIASEATKDGAIVVWGGGLRAHLLRLRRRCDHRRQRQRGHAAKVTDSR